MLTGGDVQTIRTMIRNELDRRFDDLTLQLHDRFREIDGSLRQFASIAGTLVQVTARLEAMNPRIDDFDTRLADRP